MSKKKEERIVTPGEMTWTFELKKRHSLMMMSPRSSHEVMSIDKKRDKDNIVYTKVAIMNMLPVPPFCAE